MRSAAAWLASATPETVESFLGELSDEALMALPWLFEFWALPHQMAPEGAWRTWVIMGGRGAGKTRAGAEWVRAQVEGARPLDTGRAKSVALVGETIDQVREVMVFGPSGILACSPPDRRPVWEAGRRRLVWPNGAVAQVFSAHEPESLRGPQFDAAWVDELAKWKKGQESWDMLQFALRLGSHPRQVVTTTPKNVGVLKTILKNPSTVVTHAPTEANKAYLAASFLEEIRARYDGTRLGRQELDGVLLEDFEGALWTTEMIEVARGEPPGSFSRVVVGVDPSVAGKPGSDECGIVVVGAVTDGPPKDWRAWVLEDATVTGGSPQKWAEAVVSAYHRHGASRVVAEVNQGGALVEDVLRAVDPFLPVRKVSASTNKVARAEPVAALYEQGRVGHVRDLGALEDQMCQVTRQGYQGKGSPDRVDALVWALTDVMIDAARFGALHPQVRAI
ncbi:terminase family protein [Frigidibacter sp. SD6-1]|uniref:DNA-packaging protein n=1 Tax=Frigidibacter sp. SD6-1 TaxID=3032581 RepID=UPI0024DFB12D|nr:terminase family protein [Frigidibacter sp. SD6-1]